MGVTVFVVDDHALVRSGIVRVIEAEKDLQVVGEGTGSAETLEAIRRLQPEVLIVDLEMPQIRGADLIERVKDLSPSSRTLVCTMHSAHGYVTEALRRGATGYLLKSSPGQLLVDAIRAVASGKGFIDPALQTDVIELLRGGEDRRLAADLTAKEIEVLRLAAEGCSNQEIADRTHQSVETVKLRLRRIFQKLGASDRANAVALALRRHLI
jgi:DNA-binding NarL/FixJ family response regulator